MSILAVRQVAQTCSGPHNVMSLLPYSMVVDDRSATFACRQRLVLSGTTVCVLVCWCVCVYVDGAHCRTTPLLRAHRGKKLLCGPIYCQSRIMNRVIIAVLHAHRLSGSPLAVAPRPANLKWLAIISPAKRGA